MLANGGGFTQWDSSSSDDERRGGPDNSSIREARLLSVRNLALYERDLQILIYVNLLGTEVDDLGRLAEYSDHVINGLPNLNGGWRGRVRSGLLIRISCSWLLIRV